MRLLCPCGYDNGGLDESDGLLLVSRRGSVPREIFECRGCGGWIVEDPPASGNFPIRRIVDSDADRVSKENAELARLLWVVLCTSKCDECDGTGALGREDQPCWACANVKDWLIDHGYEEGGPKVAK